MKTLTQTDLQQVEGGHCGRRTNARATCPNYPCTQSPCRRRCR